MEKDMDIISKKTKIKKSGSWEALFERENKNSLKKNKVKYEAKI